MIDNITNLMMFVFGNHKIFENLEKEKLFLDVDHKWMAFVKYQ